VFKVDYILSKAEPDERDKYQMLLKGGVVLIDILWNCNLDWGDSCFPTYQFRRFDTKETNTASGFNFRFANKYFENDVEHRVLCKAYGLRFIVSVTGTAGMFSIVPFMLSIGAGIGLMSLSVIVADCVMLHCTSNKRLYQDMKELDAHKAFNENYEVTRI
jgi:P2X purinoceptor 4